MSSSQDKHEPSGCPFNATIDPAKKIDITSPEFCAALREFKSQAGSLSWLEIPASNYSRAIKFYETCFGWTFNAGWPGASQEITEDIPYIFFTKKGTNVMGGMPKVEASSIVQANDAAKEWYPRVSFKVASIEETLEKVERNGGKTLKAKEPIGEDMGHFAVIRDSEGNALNISCFK